MLHPKESGQDTTHKYRSKYGPDIGERISVFNERNMCVLVLIGLLVFWKPELGFTSQCTLFSL